MAEKKAAADKSMSIGRTVLIYMAGKNDLTHNNSHRNYVNEDLEEIKEGSRKLSSNDCLLVFVRRYLNDNNLETPWLARIQNGEVTDSVSVRDMGIMKEDARACDPEVMVRRAGRDRRSRSLAARRIHRQLPFRKPI